MTDTVITRKTTSAAEPLTLAQQAERLAVANGVTTPLEEQPRLFLNTLWQAIPGDHLVGLSAEVEYWNRHERRWSPTVTQKWFWRNTLATSSEPLEWAQQMNHARYQTPGLGGVYYGFASRKSAVLNRYAARGTHDELLAITALFAELDCLKHGYDLSEALQMLVNVPLPPTFVIFSGGGLHTIHVLHEAWPVINREAVREYGAYSIEFYKDLYAHTGLQFDTAVQEADRIFRLPYTINQKPDRDQAMVRLVYANPNCTYSVDDIKNCVVITPADLSPINVLAPRIDADLPEGTYQVGQDFVHYLIDRQPAPPERHPVILKLAMQAARTGISAENFALRMRPIARAWYSEAPHRANDEFDKLVGWAYRIIAEDPEATARGNWLVRLTDTGFELAPDDQLDALRDRTIVIDGPAPVTVNSQAVTDFAAQVVATPAPAVKYVPTLAEVRADQIAKMREYVNAKIKGMGTYMLVRTPPGGGKTHAAIQVAYEYAMRKGTAQGGRGKVAILTQFTIDEHGWRDWLRSFGITETNNAMYIVGRTADQNSAGYCAMNVLADAVAAKGHNAVHMVCKRCPLLAQCEQSWYLSQFKRAQKKDIVIARHQHGVIEQLMDYRRLLVFDEAPLPVVASPTILALKDMTFTPPAIVKNQYGEQVRLIGNLLEALRGIISSNTPLVGHASEEHVKLGGRWLIDKLVEALGDGTLDVILSIPDDLIHKAGQPGHFSLTVEEVAALPYNYLYDLWDVLRYEFRQHYLAGRAKWNSRLIPYGQTLRVYPMRAFKFSPLTKIIVTDATGQPELYLKAFADTGNVADSDLKLGFKPRNAYVYDTELRPHAKITQWNNSGNSRRAFYHSRKGPIKLALASGAELEVDTDTEPEPVALARAKAQIKLLTDRHEGSLLVVCYMKIHSELKSWAIKSGIINPDYIQYYGNLRGRNDYKHLRACLLIGEPRIPPMEVFTQAQVWHWDEELPIDFALDASGLKQVPYPAYTASDGKGRAYGYPGYRDPRLDRAYLYAVQAEMRQCYERIRANAPEIDPVTGKLQEKFVYIAAQMPCSDHVDELMHWSQWEIDQAGRTWYEAQIAAGQIVTQAEYIEAVQQYGKWDTAQRSYQRVHASLLREGKVQDAAVEKTQLQIALDWFMDKHHPERTQMSIRQAHSQFPKVGMHTLQRAKKLLNVG